MRTIATVIARGGSKRLPRKNVLPFCGLPLVAWTIIQARCSRLVDEVWLSTDDDEIQGVGEEYGAVVVRRPDWPDADTVSGARPMCHLVRTILERTGDFDCLVSTLPTSPLRLPDQLDRLVAHYYGVGDPDRQVTQVIPQRETVLYEEAGDGVRVAIFDKSCQYFASGDGAGAIHPKAMLRVSEAGPDQDAEADAAAKIAVANKQGPSMPYITIEAWQATEVDTLEEFEFAEVLMEHFILQGKGRRVYDEYAGHRHTGPGARDE